MKIVKRIGIFETNSSSTHTLTLVSKTDYEADKETSKPKYRKFRVLDNIEDKLLMVCGCCEEIFVTEKNIDRFASFGDEDDVERKKYYEEVKAALSCGMGDCIYISYYNISYELAVSFAIRVYCELTNADYDKNYEKIVNNYSKRYLHMKFFEEGSLDNPRWDYVLISNLFEGDESEILNNLRHYFNNDFLLVYRENYAGIEWDDDDDDDDDDE